MRSRPIRPCACAVLLLLSACSSSDKDSPYIEKLVDAPAVIEGVRERPAYTFTTSNAAVRILRVDDVASLDVVAEGPQPGWLSLNGTLFQNDVGILLLGAANTDVPEGTHTAAVRVIAKDANGDVLDSVVLPVELRMREVVDFVVGSAPNVFATVGSSVQVHNVPVQVRANGERWQVASDQPWVTVPAGIQQDSQTFNAVVNTTGMDVGQGNAVLTLVNADDPTETGTFNIFLDVVLPDFTVDSEFVLGGPQGSDESARQYPILLNTGTNAYPWTLTFDDAGTDPTDWLQPNKTSGMVSGAGDTINLNALWAQMDPGAYFVDYTLQAQVLGHTVTKHGFVRMKQEENRIYVVENGVPFYQFPSRERLQADVPVRSSRGYGNVAWMASSDQAWLDVTNNGVTGQALHLEVNSSPPGPKNTVYFATVTIHSPNPRIANDEHIVVGFWEGTSDPVDELVNTTFQDAVANPVLPYVHVRNGASIKTYNLYTGAHEATFGSPYSNSTGLAVSRDGRWLYTQDFDDRDIAVIDVNSGMVVDTLARPGTCTASCPESHLGVLRIEGHEVVTPEDDLYWLYPGAELAFSRDGHRIISISNASPFYNFFNYDVHDFDYTAMAQPSISLTSQRHAEDTGQARALAMTSDESHLFVAVGAPAEFRFFDTAASQRSWAAASAGTPTNALARDDGLLVGGATVSGGAEQLYLFDASGNLIDNWGLAGSQLLDDQFTLGSDQNRLVVPTDNGVNIVELQGHGAALH